MLALVVQIVLPMGARRCTRKLAPRRAEKGEREFTTLSICRRCWTEGNDGRVGGC